MHLFVPGPLPLNLTSLEKLTVLSLSDNRLRGERSTYALPGVYSIRSEAWSYSCNKGELQLPVVRWWLGRSSASFDMRGNQGFTLPSNLGDLTAEVTALDLSKCCLTGMWAVLATRGWKQLIVLFMIWIRLHSREYWRTFELDFDWSHRPSFRRWLKVLFLRNAGSLPQR